MVSNLWSFWKFVKYYYATTTLLKHFGTSLDASRPGEFKCYVTKTEGWGEGVGSLGLSLDTGTWVKKKIFI